MDQQQQDQLWSILSEETKEEYRQKYKFHLADSEREMKCNDGGYDLTVLRSHVIVDELVNMFGSHNLNPEPQIKTWEDVEKSEGGKISVDSKVINPNGRAWGLNIKYHNKAEATLKLAILIELGYGGMVSEEEWKNNKIRKYVVKWCAPDEHPYNEQETRRKYFIAFHTPEQRDEFMSHESNRKLVEMYYLM